MTKTAVRIIALLVVLFLGVVAGTLYGQEATETAPETAITEEATTTTPTIPRIVSQELLAELRARQVDFESVMVLLEDQQKLVNYVLAKIVAEYQIDIETEVININTGEITNRPPVTE